MNSLIDFVSSLSILFPSLKSKTIACSLPHIVCLRGKICTVVKRINIKKTIFFIEAQN